MRIFEAKVSLGVVDYLKKMLKNTLLFNEANTKIEAFCGIVDFFEGPEEFISFNDEITATSEFKELPDRSEYGDFQTNLNLAKSITLDLTKKNVSPKVVIEPTCGIGNFIIASLEHFSSLKHIIGVEIYKPYYWETKFNIIEFYLKNNQPNKPRIEIINFNVFDFDFNEIATRFSKEEILVLGNPPWVTNSKLSTLNSDNLPEKTNFKNHTGLDALTGKGNFDIAEYIALMLFNSFQNSTGFFALLVKNTVIKNVLFDQKLKPYRICDIQKMTIDSKKEFNVSVEAALFFCKFNSNPQFNCSEFNFYSQSKNRLNFGWVGDKFVSNTDFYEHTNRIDGTSPFVWRQGVKHDLSAIMELEKNDVNYVNGLNQKVNLENDLVYGFLKSSDLKNTIITQTRKFTIITQKKVGQQTDYIKTQYPNTYNYLLTHILKFQARKSSIYNNKPNYSIFGIGDYSFMPYKVAISGLYKTYHFTLVLPQENKPVMLDDTCYFIGFEKAEFAAYALILLNSDLTINFLKSITFSDAKRTFTKDILMRINLSELANSINKKELMTILSKINVEYKLNYTLDYCDDFKKSMIPADNFKNTLELVFH